MRVEALKTENGFFIPVNEELGSIQDDRIILEIRVVRQGETENDWRDNMKVQPKLLVAPEMLIEPVEDIWEGYV